MIGMLTFPAAADTSPVTSVTVDKDKILNATTRYLLDTGSGYIVDDGTKLASYPWVAQFDDTTGAVDISVRDEDSDLRDENLFRASGMELRFVGKMTLDWTCTGLYDECEIKYGAGLTDDNYVIGTIPDDATSKTYAYKFPITVTSGKASVGGVEVTHAVKGATVALEAAYAPAHRVTVHNCTASVELAASGQTVTITAAPAEKGYTFSGWAVEASSVALANPASATTTFVMGDVDVEITALYSPMLYTVTVTNGTATVDDFPTTEATIEDTVTITASTPPSGKVFKEWVIETGEGTLADATSATTTVTGICGDFLIHAIYEDAIYTVTVENGTPDSATVKIGDTVEITAADPAKGYAFAGWTVVSGEVTLTDPTAVTTQFMTGVLDVVIRASYTPINYTVAVTDGTANIDGTPITQANITQTVTLAANDPAVGKKFKEWVIEAGEGTLADATSATTTLTSVYGNITVRATYEDILYTVTVTGGTSDPATAIMGTTVTVSADSVAGKKFKSWTVVSGGVTLADATAATTTFTVGTANVELIATYGYINYTVSVKDGKGNVNYTADQITDAHVGDTIHISADTPADGYYFVRWNVLSGEATIADSTADTTTFTMTAGNVELEAVYAEIVYLDEIAFTVTPPSAGDLAAVTLLPADPTKYGSVTVNLYLYEPPYPSLAPTDVFEVGSKYALRFEVVCAKGYALADGAVITVNGEATGCYGGIKDREWTFEFPAQLTVTGGKAYTSNTYETEITEPVDGNSIYLKSEAPEGKEFLCWRISVDGYTWYSYFEDSICVYQSYKEITCEAFFAIPIDTIEGTMPPIKVGETPVTTVTDESELYSIEIRSWYYGFFRGYLLHDRL